MLAGAWSCVDGVLAWQLRRRRVGAELQRRRVAATRLLTYAESVLLVFQSDWGSHEDDIAATTSSSRRLSDGHVDAVAATWTHGDAIDATAKCIL